MFGKGLEAPMAILYLNRVARNAESKLRMHG